MFQRKKQKHDTKSSIQKKLLKKSVTVITVSLILVGGVSAYLNYSSTVTSLEETMVETVKQASITVTNKMEGYEKLAYEMSFNPILCSQTATKEEKLEECSNLAERNGLNIVSLTDAEGTILSNGNSVADVLFFKRPKETGKTFVSNLNRDPNTQILSIYVSAPILRDGVFDGVVYIGVDASVLCDIVKGIQIGETGNASIISGSGDTIGYSDKQLVEDAYNTQKEVEKDPQLKQLAAIERKVMAGETGFGSYKYGGVSKYTAYTPIERSPGWGIYVAVKKSEYLKSTYVGIIIMVVLLLASIGIGITLITRSAAGIVMPIKTCVDRIRLLANGDFHSEVPAINTGDETQVLAESMSSLVENLKLVIGDIAYCLEELASGNFTVTSRATDNYIGDFSSIITSIVQLKEKLSSTMSLIMESSEQVSLGAEQMSQSAQSLAEGATEQAGTVEELSAAITNVAELSQTSAQAAEKASLTLEQVTDEAEQNSSDMEALRNAMDHISSTSKDIEKIISDIEDIASQTNLLSLNASIEAARAGEAGKGFAVVAEQIGKLASDSAQSAVNTREMIGKSLEEIEKGNAITEEAAQAFESIIEKMRDFGHIVNEVSATSQTQANSLKEIEQGVEQISSVIQNNSASAEETSATSEELSAQSATLNELMGQFHCK